MSWLRDALTDRNGEFDVAQIMLPVATFSMIAISAWATVVNKQNFDANQLGIGVGAVIAALGAYKWGDSKQLRTTETTVTAKQTTMEGNEHGN